MINIRKNYTTKHLQKLRVEVEVIFGRKIINTKDCEQLQQEIKNYSLKGSLGLNTIRRYFGIIKTETGLSKYTLDVFSSYCGYDDYNHFFSTPSKSKLHQQPINLNLIKTLYDESFQQQETKIFAKLHLEVFEAILTDSSVFQTVFPKLVHYPLFQEYVLSFHPLIDKLNQEWYMKAIRLFTRRSNITHLKVFGIAMDFLRHILNNELEKCEALIDAMKKMEEELLREYPLVVWPQARLFSSAYIFYSHMGNKALSNEYKQKIIYYCSGMHNMLKRTSQQERENSHDFLMCVCDYLSLAGDYEFIGELLENFGAVFKNGHLITSRLYNPYKIIVAIFKAEYYFYSGNKQEAKKLMKQIDLGKLTFEFKNLYTLRFLILQMQLSNNPTTKKFKTLHSQAKALSKQLEYKKFQKQVTTLLKK